MSRKLAIVIAFAISAGAVFVAVRRTPGDSGLQHKSVAKINHLHGLTVEQVLESMGKPEADWEFSMGEAHGEFRVELLNFYPPTNPASANVKIRECQWNYKTYHIAVWFHQVNGKWIALDSCRWDEGVYF